MMLPRTKALLLRQYRIALVMALAATLAIVFISGQSCYAPFTAAYTSPDMESQGMEVRGQEAEQTETPTPEPVPTPEAEPTPDPAESLPAKPEGLQISANPGSLEVTLDWDDVPGAAHYLVRWRPVGNGGKLNEGMEVQSSETNITVADYGEWVVRIEACNSVGCGPHLAQRFAVEPAPEPEPTPTPTPEATPTPEPIPTPEPTATPTLRPRGRLPTR